MAQDRLRKQHTESRTSMTARSGERWMCRPDRGPRGGVDMQHGQQYLSKEKRCIKILKLKLAATMSSLILECEYCFCY